MVDLREIVIVALGSNLGDPCRNVIEAMRRLEQFGREPLLKSSLWQSSPVDCPPDSPPFVNATVGLAPRPEETPESLLAKLQALEREFGRRTKQVHNEPRPLDLDLIVFGREIRAGKELILPHPRVHLRRFVLEPLSEIAPALVLPGRSETVLELFGKLPAQPSVQRLSDG